MVQVGSLDYLVTGHTDTVAPMLIGHQQENVGAAAAQLSARWHRPRGGQRP
jgi:hypothetical protein